MQAEILSIGTELLLGTIADTNAQYLAQRLAGLGINCYFISQVGDNQARLVETLRRAWARSELVITTGGVGPTQDDLTREAIAEMLGEELVVVPEQEARLRRFFTLRGLHMPEQNLKQAMTIRSATLLDNPVGTAPGWWVESSTGQSPQIIVAMPGVPFEMKRMWEKEAEPRLRAQSGQVLVSRTLKVLGLGESRVEELVSDLMGGSNPTLAPYAKPDGVHLRITAKAQNESDARLSISSLEEIVRNRLGDAVFGADSETPEGVVSDLLAGAGTSFAVLEIGAGAIGSLSALLGALPTSVGCYGFGSLGAMSAVLNLPELHTLEEAATALKTYTGAELVVATQAEVTPRGDDPNSVRASADMLLLSGHATEAAPQSSQQTWRTSPTEVRRLIGLAALNMLRLSLLEAEMVKL